MPVPGFEMASRRSCAKRTMSLASRIVANSLSIARSRVPAERSAATPGQPDRSLAIECLWFTCVRGKTNHGEVRRRGHEAIGIGRFSSDRTDEKAGRRSVQDRGRHGQEPESETGGNARRSGRIDHLGRQRHEGLAQGTEKRIQITDGVPTQRRTAATGGSPRPSTGANCRMKRTVTGIGAIGRVPRNS